jgi:hypothetical protein
MTKLKLTALAAAIALGCGATGTASAFTITSGDYKFTIDNYDAGTTGYPVGNPVCNTVAGCDGIVGITPAPGAVGSEDTWGIFSVASVENVSTASTIFTRGVDGYLTGVFGGLDDQYVTNVNTGPGTNTTTALAVNGFVDLYLNTTDYNPNPNGDSNGPGGRIGTTGFKSITDIGGTLWLSADFGAGVNGGYSAATYQTTYNSASIAGNGQGFLDVTGGSQASLFNTNSLTDPNGGSHDLFLTATYDDSANNASSIGWSVVSAGQVQGRASVPEPGTLFLVGGLLVGMGVVRRCQAR